MMRSPCGAEACSLHAQQQDQGCSLTWHSAVTFSSPAPERAWLQGRARLALFALRPHPLNAKPQRDCGNQIRRLWTERRIRQQTPTLPCALLPCVGWRDGPLWPHPTGGSWIGFVNKVPPQPLTLEQQFETPLGPKKGDFFFLTINHLPQGKTCFW